MKSVPLSLSKSYVSGWGLWEAVRELLQNAIDTKDYKVNFNDAERSIEIISRAGAIPTRALLLGNTSKAGNADTIGQFGEGFKLALLVLARDGVECEIFNGPCVWVPTFEHSDLFDGECLVLQIHDGAPNGSNDVVFRLFNLPEEDYKKVRRNYLTVKDVYKVFEVDGSFAFNRGDGVSRLYVNGLFVSELKAYGKQFTYSYNFTPDRIQLDRDRSTVDAWDIQSQIANLLIISGRIDIMVSLTKADAPDIEGYSSWKGKHYGAISNGSEGITFNSVLSDRAIDALLKEHGPTMYLVNKTTRAKLLQFIQTLAAEHGRKVVLLTDAHYSMIDPKSPYVLLAELPKMAADLTLDALIEEVKALKRHMRSNAYRTVMGRLQQLFYKSLMS